MYEIVNLEPKSEIGLAKNIFFVAAVVSVIEGISRLFLLEWSIVEPVPLFIGTAVIVFLKLTLLAWFASLLERGKMAAVVIQSALFPIAMGILITNYVNADSYQNKMLGLVGHTYVFSVLSLILVPLILYANWSVILKVRKGVLRVVS
jgi:hypothetical protein